MATATHPPRRAAPRHNEPHGDRRGLQTHRPRAGALFPGGPPELRPHCSATLGTQDPGQPQRPLTIGELAGQLLVHQSSASLLVHRLERRGLVRRARVRDDRRFVRIELTERGAALAAAAPAPAQGRLLHGLGAMSPARVHRTWRAVEDLVRIMEAENVEARFFFADG